MKPIDKNTINEFENLTSSDSHVRSKKCNFSQQSN